MFFEEIKKNFGFGCMRLPMLDNKKVDEEEFARMIKVFLDAGFNYFDTAHGYLNGESEIALNHCLTSVYPRSSYVITDKLTEPYFSNEASVKPFIESQLRILGVDYIDFYLMHAQSSRNYDKFQRCHAYEQAFEMKAEGKLRHIGLSFHDSPEVLDRILTDHPQVEFVQLQFNYLDFFDSKVQSKACYDVCVKHGKPVIVMEPVKGGRLANLPKEAQAYLREAGDGSFASFAVRFAASFPNVMMVLSGMSNLAQMEDNVSFMKDFRPLDEKEMEAVGKVREYLSSLGLIQCTACAYCVEGCPKRIPIPDVFSALNDRDVLRKWDAESTYWEKVKGLGKASECIKCGRCERTCPQALPIRDLLERAAAEFEGK